jgi:hypothetical protein
LSVGLRANVRISPNDSHLFERNITGFAQVDLLEDGADDEAGEEKEEELVAVSCNADGEGHGDPGGGDVEGEEADGDTLGADVSGENLADV